MSNKQLPKRSEVPVELTWDLTKTYKSLDAWEADFELVKQLLPTVDEYKGEGAFTKDGQRILDCLRLRDRIDQILSMLYVYANMASHVDMSDDANQALVGRAEKLATEASQAMAFISPQILEVDEESLEEFLQNTYGLEMYEHELRDLMRERKHVRSPEVEAVLASAGEIYGGPGSIVGMLRNVDLRLPTVRDENGNKAKITQGNWSTKWMENPDRDTRRRAYNAMFNCYSRYENTWAAAYAAYVNTGIFRARTRGYDSVREMRLSGNNIPVSVYDSLVDTVHANFDKLNRYLELRKRIMGLDTLAWYDLYMPLVSDLQMKVTWDEAKEEVLAAVAPLGDRYVSGLREGLSSRWVDVVENENKKGGAYSWGTYGTPPYMLLNWQDSLDAVYTLAHEAGHSMHTWHTFREQPYHYSGYTIFVAEVASTFNEALLTHYLLGKTDNPGVRKYILSHQLEGIRATLVRQTMFAEFEKLAHEKAEAGVPLTPQVLRAIHQELNEKYYGSVVKLDKKIGIEWARIPHFYGSFYVYQYATGISAAMDLARQVIEEGEPAVKRYLNFLSQGSSDYSLNLLRDAGVDLTTPQPVQAAFDAFDNYVNLFEELL